MEENNKLFVFEKKEVFLIFIFIVMIAAIAFTMGVRVGKQLSLKHDNYTNEDVKKIELKSVEEEYVDQVVPADKVSNGDLGNVSDKQSEMEKRLKEEMQKLASEKPGSTAPEVKVDKSSDTQGSDILDKIESEAKQEPESKDMYNQSRDFNGKYTIQLYSNQSEDAAKDFADGFIVKGYDVIINEVVIAGKGKWYRVSIGVFNDVNEAKDFLSKEKALFQSSDYVIQKF